MSTLLLLAGTCVFSLSFPLVSPIFLLYLLIKHVVDIQNLRLFYTAREHQPMLLRTAVQVAMVCPVLAQAQIAIYHITNDIYAWSQSDQAGEPYRGDSSATLWSGSLFIVNSTMLLMAQVIFTCWHVVTPTPVIQMALPLQPLSQAEDPPGTPLSRFSGTLINRAKHKMINSPKKLFVIGGGGGTGWWLYRDPALDAIVT